MSWIAAGIAPASADEPCIEPCVAQLSTNESGQIPAGTVFLITPVTVTSGTGTPYCAATCTICWAKVTISFNGNGAFGMSHDFDGAGWSTPVDWYVRNGILKSRCSDPNPGYVCFRIMSNGTTINDYVYEACSLLACECL